MTFKGTPYDELLQATEDNLAKFWLSLGLETDMSIQTTQVITGIPHPLLNIILRAQFPAQEIPFRVRGIVNKFNERQLPFSWWIGREHSPQLLSDQLLSSGLNFLGTFPGMGIFLKDIETQIFAPHNFKIKTVTENAELREWGMVEQKVFSLPNNIGEAYNAIFARLGLNPRSPHHHFLGLLDGKAVASATLFVYEDIAGIYNLTVLPEARGKGIATAMILHLLSAAKYYHCRLSVLQSSSMMFNVYKRLGFLKMMEWKVFFSRGYTHFPSESIIPQN